MDLDLACWFCGAPFDRDAIARGSTILPRRMRDGGPILVLRCRACDRPIHLERNAAGAYWARPPDVAPVIDAFFAWFDAELAADLERKRAFERRAAGKREWFHREYVEMIAAGAAPSPTPPPPPRSPPPPPPAPPPPEPPPPERDPYAVLGLAPGAGPDAFTSAFRELAKRYHPDRFANLDEEFQRLAHARFLELKRAYDALAGSHGEHDSR